MSRKISGCFAALRLMAAGWVLGAGLAAPAAELEMHLSTGTVREEVRATVAGQLAALANGNFPAAYAFASTGIKRQFDERLYGAMIRRGYAPLLHPEKTDLGLVRDDGAGQAQLSVTVTDGANRSTRYRYSLVLEKAGWRVSGVVLDPGPVRGTI